jgi:hypothetical protein
MTSTVDRKTAIKIHKYLRKFEEANWFQRGQLSIGFQSRQLQDMHNVAGIWTPPSMVDFFAYHPEGETSKYKWTYRRVDELKNLYVTRK